VGDELVESVEGDERCDFAHTHEDGAGSRFFAGNVTAVGFLHCSKLSTSNIAELAQGVLAVRCAGLNFLWS